MKYKLKPIQIKSFKVLTDKDALKTIQTGNGQLNGRFTQNMENGSAPGGYCPTPVNNCGDTNLKCEITVAVCSFKTGTDTEVMNCSGPVPCQC